MNRLQRQALIFGILVCVMAAVYARAFALRRSARRPAVPPTAASAQRPVGVSAGPDVSSPQEVLAHREAQRAYAGGLSWNRDPFARGRTGAVGGFTLSGILWDAQQPIAIINGQMLQVGEELDGYRVADIGQDHVSLTDGTHTYQLLIAP